MTFPGSPRVLKGAIVGLDPFRPLASVVVFQYNPDTLTRTIQARAAGGGDSSISEALRLKGPPTETIRLDVEVDATDQLERSDGIAAQVGLSLKVLSYDDLGLLSVGGGLVLAHQIVKEVMATISGTTAVAGALSGSGSISVSVGG